MGVNKAIKYLKNTIPVKNIRKIGNVPFYRANEVLHPDIHVSVVSDLSSSRHKSFHSSLMHHSNHLVQTLRLSNLPNNPRRSLKRWPRDLLRVSSYVNQRKLE